MADTTRSPVSSWVVVDRYNKIVSDLLASQEEADNYARKQLTVVIPGAGPTRRKIQARPKPVEEYFWVVELTEGS